MYPTLKTIHFTCVVISFSGFLLRGILAQRNAAVMQQRWIRIVPHFNDTLLLGSAVAMALMSGQYPLATAWLTAKLVGLVIYVALGVVALRGRSTRARQFAFWAAVCVFVWIVSVATQRHPAGVFVVLG
jgi:uncharacterized membrane protein SirB2